MAEGTSALHRRILLLRWALPLALFLLVTAYETWEHALLLRVFSADLESGSPFFFLAGTVIYGAAGPSVIWLVLSWIANRVAEQQRAQEELEAVHTSLKEAHTQLQESAQQLATLHEISRAIASTVDLREVTDGAVQAIARISGAQYACLGLLDEEQGRWTQVSSSRQGEHYGQHVLSILDSSLQAWRRGDRKPIWLTVPTPAEDEAASVPILGVPIARGPTLLGAIHVCLASSQSAENLQVELLTTIADEIAAAIEAARLRTRHLQALYDVDQTVRTEFNLDRLLEQILGKMLQLCSADVGTVTLVEARTNSLVVTAAVNLPDSLGARLEMDGTRTPWQAAEVANSGTALVVPDINAETRWRSHIAVDGIQSVMSVPMIASEQVIGVISLGHRRRAAFSKVHLGILSAISDQAALVVRNTQLYNRAEELAIAEERNRIAREIHDGLAQNLAFLGLKADLCGILLEKMALAGPEADHLRKEIGAIKDGLRENIRGVRRSIFTLRPLELERLGFAPALRKFAEDFGEQNGLHIHLSIAGEEALLPSQLEPPLFRVVQEALNNVRKYATARNVWIDLDLEQVEQLRLCLRDDGIGFDAGILTDAPRRGHRGIAQMKERIASLGGGLDIDTAPGCGTRLAIKLPLKRQARL